VRVLYFQFVIVAAVFGGIAWVAAGRGGGVADAVPDRPDVALPDDRQLGRADIDGARFTIGWRGYRMDEVDQVLDRLAAEIDYRDRLIAELDGSEGGNREPVSQQSQSGATAYQSGATAYQPEASPYQSGATAYQPVEPEQPDDDVVDSGSDSPLSAWYHRPQPPA
jgi:DivIVA domain-containing protein